MARIHYSLAGEGRGHATRARTLIEELRREHSLTIHTFGDAHDLLDTAYAGTEVEVRRIPGARFHYSRRGRVDVVRTALGNARLVGGARGLIGGLARSLERDAADVVVTDFEPMLPRAARSIGLPVVAVDHQSALAHGDLRALGPALSRHARMLGVFVRAWVPRPDVQISSSFYVPPRRPASGRVHFVGVLLRRQLREIEPTDGRHVVAYLRRGAPAHALETLARLGREVRLYGLDGVAETGSLRPRPVSEAGFIEDLASCAAVVTTAGNQLVGEALHLGKPVLAFPEPGNREQEINAWFLGRTGAGRAESFDRFDLPRLHGFMDEVPELGAHARSLDVDGTDEALELVTRATAVA